MLILNKSALKDVAGWQTAGIETPRFDIDHMITVTQAQPAWVHFGSGNIFRGFLAALQQELLTACLSSKGIVAVETYDAEIIDKIYRPHDNLSILVLMGPDGAFRKKIIASVGEAVTGSPSVPRDWERLKEIFAKPSLQMASLTITEKGYRIKETSGDYLDEVRADMELGPDAPRHIMSKLAALMYERYRHCATPIALVSMDNCSHNGEKLQQSVLDIVQHWVDGGLVERGFAEYMADPSKVTFPWTMIDKITPRPSDTVRESLEKSGVVGMELLCTAKKTYMAPFVNAEVSQYLVVEDSFPNGRPVLEKAGVLFTDRDTVEKVERMKVTTCLNPLHTALAVFGCLLGYHAIADELRDAELKKLIERIGYQEAMPVVVNPGVLDPMDFIKEVIDRRFPNPYIPDTPQRIATDTSQKIAIRFGETIKAYQKRDDLDVKSLRYIPMALAGWCRYLTGVDDQGNIMPLSPDPMLSGQARKFADIRFGEYGKAEELLSSFLRQEEIFGVDLYRAGLSEHVIAYFNEMISGVGAVRAFLINNLT